MYFIKRGEREENGMDIRQLRYFIAVAEELNFTKAAQKLFLGQPAVSQQIASLEKTMGVKLFNRNKHSVELTNAGTVFLKDAREIVERLGRSIENARQAEEGLAGTINIGLLSVSVRRLLPIVVRAFRKKYPKVNMNFVYYNTGQIIKTLQNDEIDIGFTLSHGIQNIAGVEYKTLWEQRKCVVVPYDHPLAKEKEVLLEKLAGESFVMLNREESLQGYEHVLAMCAAKGFSPNIVSSASRIDAVLMIVEAGIGISIVSKHLKTYASPGLRFIDIVGDDNSVNVIAAWKRSSSNPCIPLFIQEVNLALNNSACDFSKFVED
ncbi:LysR family transcriptional regulator [Neobacillus niacini]|uniref:LysR family transcriptional regulator n=1 Tax=Neobacillus niacini TaxID=86668 RepID=UPI003000966C